MNQTSIHSTNQKKLGTAFFWVIISYVLAIGAGVFTEYFLREYDILTRFLAADVVATVIIFGFSLVFNNSSFYDAYWSVIPISLAVGFIYFASSEVNSAR